jgi:transposase
MDNAQIHRANILYEIFRRINVFYAPPYSPFLNPIEEYFSLVKNRLRKCKFYNRDELIRNLH